MAFHFEITDEVLHVINLESLSGVTQERLLELKFEPYDSKGEFCTALQEALPKGDYERYRALLLHEALVPTTFEVNRAVLLNLEAAQFPKATLENLTNLASDKRLDSKSFELGLQSAIGQRQASRYRTMLLRHCQERFILPYYPCPVGDRQFLVDVTLSAPPQSDPSKVTYSILAEFNKHFEAQYGHSYAKPGTGRTLCDMGTGKLRNLEPFLEAGYTIVVCDYEDQYEYAVSENRLQELRDKYEDQLRTWIFPEDFQNGEIEEFDGILLLNIMHIIPFPGDRELVVGLCAGKLKSNGLLAWQTPYGDTHMKKYCVEDMRYADGWILRPDQSRQTFYTEFRIEKIRELLTQYSLEDFRKVKTSKNKVEIFRKTS